MTPTLVCANSEEIKIAVSGRIDTETESSLEKFIYEIKGLDKVHSVIFDFEQVEYISSAGLRLILKIIKQVKSVQVVNVSHDVYDVFEMTGFIQLCSIQKAYRQMDVTGCKVIGQGANGVVYRLDSERILKLYTRPNVLNDIIAEKAHAKYAFLLGIPTAISFDIVKVGEHYGSVFELLEAQSVANLIIANPCSMDTYIAPYADLLKSIHSIRYEPKADMSLAPATERLHKNMAIIQKNSSVNISDALESFAKDLPKSDTMLHGDCQPNNVMLTKDGMIFIDMDSLSYGDEIFDMGYLYATMVVFDQYVTGNRKIFDCPQDTVETIFKKTFEYYYSNLTGTEKSLKLAMAKILGYSQVLAFSYKHPDRISKEKQEQLKDQFQKVLSEYSALKN